MRAALFAVLALMLVMRVGLICEAAAADCCPDVACCKDGAGCCDHAKKAGDHADHAGAMQHR